VTWPLLAPTLGPALLIRTVFAFNQFYVFYVFANSTDGRFPLSTLALTSFFVFDPSGGGGAFAMSAALNLVTVVMLIAFALRLQRWQGAAERRAYA
jgi:ABC-type sugar transport system permease subunit